MVPSGKGRRFIWWLIRRGTGRDKAGESSKPPTLCSAEELDFILRSVETMQYLEWENDVISHVENKLVGAWTWTHTNIIFLLLRSELKNSEKKKRIQGCLILFILGLILKVRWHLFRSWEECDHRRLKKKFYCETFHSKLCIPNHLVFTSHTFFVVFSSTFFPPGVIIKQIIDMIFHPLRMLHT